MENKTKLRLLIVSLIFCLLATLSLDFWLSNFGQNTIIFKTKFPHDGITFEYDKLQGYKFLEDGFIHILDENTVFGNDTIISILAYKVSESDIYVKTQSNSGRIIYINIHLLDSPTGELKYELIEYQNNLKDWIDISNIEKTRLIVTLRNILIVIVVFLGIISLTIWLWTLIRKT